jgi:hypothetical protein
VDRLDRVVLATPLELVDRVLELLAGAPAQFRRRVVLEVKPV